MSDAVLVLVQALDRLHRDICGGKSGLCRQLKCTAGTNELAKKVFPYLRNASITGERRYSDRGIALLLWFLSSCSQPPFSSRSPFCKIRGGVVSTKVVNFSVKTKLRLVTVNTSDIIFHIYFLLYNKCFNREWSFGVCSLHLGKTFPRVSIEYNNRWWKLCSLCIYDCRIFRCVFFYLAALMDDVQGEEITSIKATC